MERETRIELATNSLEGCDSTIELLPPFGDNCFYLFYSMIPILGLTDTGPNGALRIVARDHLAIGKVTLNWHCYAQI
jgi:hypothetical protein